MPLKTNNQTEDWINKEAGTILTLANEFAEEAQARNSIDIFLGPESGPEPCPSHVWIFQTCLNL